MDSSFSIEELSQAARPTLFDTAARPELLISIIYANLMSPSLWKLMRKIRARATELSDTDGTRQTTVFMKEIHDYVDKKFCHFAPLDIVKYMGLLDLEEEKKRLSGVIVDEAIDCIMKSLYGLEKEDRLKLNQNIFDIVNHGKFPEYYSSPIDVIESFGSDVHQKHRPLGVTICADEATLIASLAVAEGCIGTEDIVILGSPVHYTLFLEHGDEGFWFNGKHEFHDSTSWREFIKGFPDQRIQRAFDSRVFNFDRVITPLGIHLLRHGRSTMSPDQIRIVYSMLKEYFGIDIRQIIEAQNNITYDKSSILEIPAVDFSDCKDAGQVEKMIRVLAGKYPNSIFELALYSFRSIQVPYPEAYIRASLRGHRVRNEAKVIRNLDDAISVAANLSGSSSIYKSFQRIALPDEVLHFRTGNHREIALLLYCLLRLSPGIARRERDDMEICFGDGASYLRTGKTYVDAATLKQCIPMNRPLISMCENDHSG